jgi:hypothetical protein
MLAATRARAHVSADLADTAKVRPVLRASQWLPTQQTSGPSANLADAHLTERGDEPERAPWVLRTATLRLLSMSW